MEKLRSTEFPNNSKHICVNNAYQDLVSKFLQETNSVAPIQTIRVKTNPKSWLDILYQNHDNPIRNHDKQYKKLKKSGKEIERANSNAKLSLKNYY